MQLSQSFKNNIPFFISKLKQIEPSTLQISDYSKRYLQHLLTHAQYYLSIYAYVLDNLLQQSEKNETEINLVDYGAGNGLLGIFAKFGGFNKVFICDLDADFVQASNQLSAILNVPIDGFIEGDIHILKAFTRKEKIHAIVGTDVIEHIYSLEDFFSTIHSMNEDMITVFTTASNPDNFIKVNKLKKIQLKDEYEGSSPEDSILTGATEQAAYLAIRKNIIAENFPLLPTEKMALLAEATRGFIQSDILKSIEEYLQTGKMPIPDRHSTNTCDPITGSWTERILSIDTYKKIYAKNGFSVNIKNGFYNNNDSGIKKFVNTGLNLAIAVLGKKIAPFITLVGCRQV